MHDNRTIDIAWAAGFFDGEGCIHIGRVFRGVRPVYVPMITVSQVAREPLDELQRLFAGGIYNASSGRPNSKPLLAWKAAGGDAERAVREMIPYLLVKRAQAEVFLAFRERITQTVGRGGLSEIEVAARDSLRDQMAALNYRGVA